MGSRNNISNSNCVKIKPCKVNYSDIPIECIRKTRSLNIDLRSSVVSGQMYKIIKSNNGRKIFT